MEKSNNIVSLAGTKRGLKNRARLRNKMNRVENHIQFLYKNISSGKMTMDLDKLSTKTVINKLTGKPETSNRSHKETKYIIDRLVSLQEKNK